MAIRNNMEFFPNVKGSTSQNLLEDIYTSGKSSGELLAIDGYFEELIALVNINTGVKTEKSAVDKILKKIAAKVNKIFNINLALEIDYKHEAPTAFAYTYVKQKSFQEVSNQVKKEVLIDEKEGYKFIKLTDAEVYFENSALRHLKFPELSTGGANKNKSIPAFPPLSGRELTYILLHEIGHNIFVYFNYSQRTDGAYEITVKGRKPIIVYPNKTSKEAVNEELWALVITSIIAGVGAVITGSVWGVLPAMLMNMTSQNNDPGSTGNPMGNEYMRIEKNANTLPFQYGYANELSLAAARISWYSRGASKRFSLSRLVLKLYGKGDTYQTKIIRDILAMIDAEIANPNTTPDQKKALEENRKFITDSLADIYKNLNIKK